MALPLHSKIINKLARETLKPLGVTRKGQSRLWYDDNDWFLTLIEFQPSRWSKGTYLNIGICWLWYPKDTFSFQLSYRENAFVEFETEEQFSVEVQKFVDIAKERVLSLREELSSPEMAKNFVLENTVGSKDNVWASLNRAMICIYAADYESMEQFLQDVIDSDDYRDWAEDVKLFAKKILVLAPEARIKFIENSITESRALKGLVEKKIVLASISASPA